MGKKFNEIASTFEGLVRLVVTPDTNRWQLDSKTEKLKGHFAD